MANVIRLKKIFSVCCEVSGLDLSRRNRKQEYITGRMVFYSLARESYRYNKGLNKSKFSYQEIADAAKQKSHASVTNALWRLNGYREMDDPIYEDFRYLYEECREAILRNLTRGATDIEGFSSLEDWVKYLKGVNRKRVKAEAKQKLEILLLKRRLEEIESDDFLQVFKPVPNDLIERFKKNTLLPFLKVNKLYIN
tara:strand:- start:66204 stop:66791 length:588 start_codon:yes stop_codon:yes gene_type:complete